MEILKKLNQDFIDGNVESLKNEVADPIDAFDQLFEVVYDLYNKVADVAEINSPEQMIGTGTYGSMMAYIYLFDFPGSLLCFAQAVEVKCVIKENENSEAYFAEILKQSDDKEYVEKIKEFFLLIENKGLVNAFNHFIEKEINEFKEFEMDQFEAIDGEMFLKVLESVKNGLKVKA